MVGHTVALDLVNLNLSILRETRDDRDEVLRSWLANDGLSLHY